jgi:diguanylate cyclase (GGDEF)-like protein
MAFVRGRAWQAVVLLGLALTSGRVALGPSALGDLCLLALATVAVLSIAAGPRLHQVRAPRPWYLFTLSVLSFGGLIAIQSGWTPLDPTSPIGFVPYVCAYAWYLVALLWLLRTSGAVQPQALADGLIVAFSLGGVGYVLLVSPAVMPSGAGQALIVLMSFMPFLDACLLLAALAMAFTSALRSPSLYGLLLSAVGLLLGDLSRALLPEYWTGHNPWVDSLYLMAAVAMALCALHPSVGRLSDLGPRRVRAWSTPRLALVTLAVITPVVLLAGGGWLDDERMALAGAALSGVVMLSIRAVAAVTAHSRVQRDLHHQALHDPLTGLPNRAGLLAQTRRMAAADGSGRPWLVAVDLDGFGAVNDTWGHDVGDRLLLAAARRLGEIAPPDAVVARTGGDEFVVLLRTDGAGALGTADKLCSLLRDSLLVDALDVVLTASLGVAGEQPGQDAHDLLRDADSAMYRAKAEGRNQVVSFDQGIRERIKDRAELETALRQAIARHQLHVVYQPLVEVESQRVIGAEALLRWNHPVLGQVPPTQFIPIAEETGMILDIGTWVLGEAARCLANWRRAGVVDEDFVMSVNTSTRQLRDRDLRDIVESVLHTTGLPPECLVLEITESAMLEDPDLTIQVMEQVRALGVGLSVDDFGTGYSSLAYLSRLPVTVVKLDRTFIEGIGHRSYDEAIVRAVRAIAVALQLDLVAEGVETVEQRDALRALGVPTAQGWLWGAAVGPEKFVVNFGRPVPVAEPTI